MEYKIKVNVTVEDYKSFIFDNWMKKKISTILSICIILAAFVFFLINFLFTEGSSIPLRTITFVILFFVFLIIKLSRSVVKIYNSDSLLQEGYSLIINETAITSETDRGSFSYKVDDFKEVLFGKKVISMYVSQQKAVLIPRHCFSSKDEENEIENFIKTYYVKKEK
ncbi:MAG: YcxB family protein [Treponema sp.]|nr:YcxB family protein [Treponema sp.]